RQSLDRIDVVMWRWRNEADPRNGVADLGDVRRDLVSGKLSALTRLRALRHLDLELIGIDQIFRGHAEAARGYLLDLRAQRIAFMKRHVGDHAVEPRLERFAFLDERVAARILAAFAGVRLAAN